jgi:hypothetical protein
VLPGLPDTNNIEHTQPPYCAANEKRYNHPMRLPSRNKIVSANVFTFLLGLLLLAQSAVAPGNRYESLREYTRMVEFDFIGWTLDALWIKNVQGAVNAPEYMDITKQRNVVFEYMRLVKWVNATSAQVNQIYADPDINNPDQAAASLNDRLRSLKSMEASLKPIAEAVLQYQVSTVVADMNLSFAGQPIPPVLYHVTRLPNALIISPRNAIRQDENISLMPEMTTDEITHLEDAVEKKLDVSALVVPVGGIGTYPTMVMSTTDMNWLMEVVSHEWTHNFLTLRPLGLNYMSSGEMRTINETTANISGKEIGQAVIVRYYPELAPPPPAPVEEKPKDKPAPTPQPEDPNVFNFNREMHKTRVQVDEMLAQGKIVEAENYMEQRRKFFWDNGYQLRKLNQAYFAFYGAYNDQPGGGAAGQDPVGPAVQELRQRSRSLADFLNRISWVTSFDGLLQLIK